MDVFRAKIHFWYNINKRDLPWRETQEPYRVWLSEIILQQTRVAQGMDYYLRFIKEYPTVFDLAMASEDEILKLWQGLGYYSRARNLLFTAKYIMEFLDGIFPSNYESILKLKGVGEYTAAAIASIAFDLPYAVVDGNVYRVLSRYFGITNPIDTNEGKKVFAEIASELINGTEPGMHNQSMMEFGALHCVPINPDCFNCPVHTDCYAFANNQISRLPVKKNKTKIRNRYFNYFVIFDGEFVFLQKRTENDIWKNMYEFPMVECKQKSSVKSFLSGQISGVLDDFQQIELVNAFDWQVHQLTHQKISYRFLVFNAIADKKMTLDLIKVDKKDIFSFAVPKLLENLINNKMFF